MILTKSGNVPKPLLPLGVSQVVCVGRYGRSACQVYHEGLGDAHGDTLPSGELKRQGGPCLGEARKWMQRQHDIIS